MIKITTFYPFLISIGFYTFYNFILNFEPNIIKIFKKYGFIILGFIISISIGYVWVLYTDLLKSQSYISNNLITSSKLNDWNFGTFSQKSDIFFWVQINKNSLNFLIYSISASILAYCLNLNHKKFILTSTIFSLITFITFTNLYQVHDYYNVALVFFYSASVGLFFVSLTDKTKNIWLKTLFILSIFALNFITYFDRYQKFVLDTSSDLKIISELIQNKVKKTEIIFVVGMDWDSTIPFYSKRKCVCLPFKFEKEFKENTNLFCDKLNTGKLQNLLIINNKSFPKDNSLLIKNVTKLGLKKTLQLNTNQRSATLFHMPIN